MDVSAIVLEVPSVDLNGADTNIAAWATTTDANGNQIDRVGRPAINTALIVGDDQKDLFNVSDTADDVANFQDAIAARISDLRGEDPQNPAGDVTALAGVLTPDVLTFDTADAGGFLNGRGLGDDVIDAELGLITDGGITGDGVDANDAVFLNVFPFLTQANATAVPEPTGALAIAFAFGAIVARRRRR